MDGRSDSTFATMDHFDIPKRLIVLSDGKILFLGTALYRLLPNGQTDPTFNVVNAQVSALATQKDGKLLITGAFNSIHGVPRPGFARLNADGTLDFTFSSPPARGFDLEIQSDGRILMAGGRSVTRFFSDGRLDSSFLWPVTASNVGAIAVDASDRIYVSQSGGLVQQVSGQVRVRVLPSDVPLLLERSSVVESGWTLLQSVPANTSGDYIDTNYPGTGNMFYRTRPAP